MIFNIIKVLCLVYVIFMTFLFVIQRSLIYFPDKNSPASHKDIEDIRVSTKDGLTLRAWYIPPKNPDGKIIVLFHGNAGNFSHRIHKSLPYLQQGYGVLLAEYRGYGGNEGWISEDGFYYDGRAYMDFLLIEKKIAPQNIVLYGESLGSGTATQMATEYKVAGLVLEVPFSSLLDVAKETYFYVPVDYLLLDRYMNRDKIGNINMPLLILAGKWDEVIPARFAEKLFEHAKEPKEIVIFPEGDHHNLYLLGAEKEVIKFLDGLESKNEDNDEEK